jgi:hypothetical protein
VIPSGLSSAAIGSAGSPNTSGRNTITLDSVDATVARLTSRPPWRIAWAAGIPWLARSSIASTITTALSTSIPTPSTSPSSTMQLSSSPRSSSTPQVASSVSGMHSAATSVVPTRRRNRYSTITPSSPP